MLSLAELERDRRISFITIFFNTYGHISMVDGHSSEIERTVVHNLMQVLELKNFEKKLALNAYMSGQSEFFKLSRELLDFKKQFKYNKSIRELFIRLQFEGSLASDDESHKIFDMLFAIGSQVNVSAKFLKIYSSDANVDNIKKFYRKPPIDVSASNKRKTEKPKDKFDQDGQGKWYNVNSELNKAYKLLGLSPGDEIADIKRSYRLLMNKYHPDKILHKNITDSEREFAKNQTIKILKAYELIKQYRNFN